MIKVQGYAPSTGSLTLNQKLSSERVNTVLSIIQRPVTNYHSRKGQAGNRRVNFTVLVNKGIMG